MVHAQRAKDFFAGKVAQRFAGNIFHNALQGDEVQATVAEVGGWLESSSAVANVVNHYVAVGLVIFLF